MIYETESFKPEISTPVETLKFEIGDPLLIFDMICNRIYSSPLETSIQEYMSNARDSHREAGCPDKPILVVFPTDFDRTIHIRDFGVGISPERMKNVFVRLGVSTKRDSNIQTGGFGVGAKSAFSYTDNFTIKTAYNGKIRTYLSYIGENGPDMDVLSEEDTDVPNFTDISFEIKEEDLRSLERIILKVSAFWTVLPEMKNVPYEFLSDLSLWPPKPICDGNKWGYYRIPQHLEAEEWIEPFMACCDGILYPVTIPQDCLDLLGDKRGERETLIFFFDVGEVDLAITRESLQYTEKTKKKVREKCDALMHRYKTSVDNLLILNSTDNIIEKARKFFMDTPFVYSVDLEVIPGMILHVTRKDEKRVRIKMKDGSHNRFVTRVYDITSETSRQSEVHQGLWLYFDYKTLMNDKDSNRVAGGKLRALSELSGKSRVHYITLPKGQRDGGHYGRSYDGEDNSNEISDIKICEIVGNSLKQLGVYLADDVKPLRSKRTSYTAREIYVYPSSYLSRICSTHYNRDKVLVHMDDIETDDNIIVIPPEFADKYKISNHQYTLFHPFLDLLSDFLRFLSKHHSHLRNLSFYRIDNKKALKACDKSMKSGSQIYDRFYLLLEDLVHQLRFIDDLPLQVASMKVVNYRPSFDVHYRSIPTKWSVVLNRIDQLHPALWDDLQFIVDSKTNRKNMLAEFNTMGRTPGIECCFPEEGFVKKFMEKWPEIYGKRKIIVDELGLDFNISWPSFKYRFKRALNGREAELRRIDKIYDFFGDNFPLIFGHDNSDVPFKIMEEDGIIYINQKMRLKTNNES